LPALKPATAFRAEAWRWLIVCLSKTSPRGSADQFDIEDHVKIQLSSIVFLADRSGAKGLT
jgi:hypothetical protein